MNNSAAFRETVWDAFDLGAAVRQLIAGTETYFEQNAIVTAALGAWVVSPYDHELRKVAIARKVLRACIRIERDGYSQSSRETVIFAEAFARIGKPGMLQFYEEVYYPIGGLQAIAEKFSMRDFQSFFLSRSAGVFQVAEIVSLYHYHGVKFREKDAYYKASLNRVSDFLAENWGRKADGDGAVSRRSLTKLFHQHKSSLAFIYAASMINAPPFGSLLEALESGSTSWHDHQTAIKRLFGYAKYIQDLAFTRLYQNSGVGISLDDLGVNHKPFKIREMDPDRALAFEQAFLLRKKQKVG